MTEKEIRTLLKTVLQGRKKIHLLEEKIEQSKKTHRDIKRINDERIRGIQEENRQLDSDLGVMQTTVNKERSDIETEIYAKLAKLLRRITLCNLKNLFKTLQPPKAPTADQFLTRIYVGRFAIIYDEITLGEKPVNKYEWVVRIALSASENNQLRDFLNAWPTYKEIHWSYRETAARFYQRDFPSKEKAIAYSRRNKAKICKDLIHGIKQFDQEVESADDNIDTVFDFRLIIDPTFKAQYARSDEFKVIAAEKHRLIVSPKLNNYEAREGGDIKPYAITIIQQGYQLTISGHRLPSEARQLKYAICRYFNTEFKAIEKDTQQEISDPRW